MSNVATTTLSDALTHLATPTERTERLFELMRQHGQSFYDEAVTQLEHSLRAANLARAHKASPEQVTAALLHDLGHFILDEHDKHNGFLAEDWYHEEVGAKCL
jgi:predicted HD phosphohydrolase